LYHSKNQAKRAEKNRKQYAKNREDRKSYQRAYTAANREAVLAQAKARYAKNRESILRQKREYRLQNSESIREAHRKWKENNPEYSRIYREKNPELFRGYRHSRRALLLAAWVEHVDPALVFERNDYVCQRCHIKCQVATWPARDYATLDHIIPLEWGVFRGGFHSYANSQTLCHSCNSAKGNRE
jgi:5-methylcytosine-specific restriction endonuclease McrA